MNLTFGPLNSRRFGMSLGIDLSPNKKICNFDCLYCELEKSKPLDLNDNEIKPDDYIKEIKKALQKYPNIEVLTLTANGEPTLYRYLDELVEKINKIKQNKKLLILTNGSLVYKENIAKTLQKIDIVKISLDCATKECFKKLDRISKNLDYKKIINGIINFSKIFKNELVIEILVVKGINDKKEEILKIKEILKQINPNRVDLSTIDRPPAYEVELVSFEKLLEIKEILKEFNVTIASKNKTKQNLFYSKEDLLNLLNLRSLSEDDIEILFDNKTKTIFYKLLNDRLIKEYKIAGVKFYGKS